MIICNTLLSFTDIEPPEFKFCPPNQYSYTSPGEHTASVFWKNPEAIDNSGDNVSVVCSHSKGHFQIGQTKIVCEATDQSNNTASCTFNVSVEG